MVFEDNISVPITFEIIKEVFQETFGKMFNKRFFERYHSKRIIFKSLSFVIFEETNLYDKHMSLFCTNMSIT